MNQGGNEMEGMNMNCRWAKRIATNPKVLAGKPIVAGTRISVELILDCMASGWSVDKVVEAYRHYPAARGHSHHTRNYRDG